MTVLTFGAVSEIVGKSDLDIDDVQSTDELKEKLETAFPRLKNINYAIAVNKQIVTGATALNAASTVALLPPFSGG